MAEPIRLQAAVAASPTGIKQEPEVETNILDGIDFNMIAELASKRSFDDISQDNDTDHDEQAKRLKKETQIEEEEDEDEIIEEEEEDEGGSLEDGLALLVQNALSNVGDLVDQLNVEPEAPNSDDPMDVSGEHNTDARPAPVSFLSEPEKYVRFANTHALGNLALSLLLVLLQQPVDDMKMARDADSGYGRSYGRLKRSFDATWQLFSDDAILSADELEIQEADARTLIDLANLAKFGTWLVAEDMESFSAAEEHLTKVFQCQLPDVPAGTSDFFVGIKTQKVIDALQRRTAEQQAEDLIRASFPESLEQALEAASDGSEPSSAAREFVSLSRSRRDALIQVLTTDKEDSLKEKYPAGDSLRGFAAYVQNKLASLTELGEKFGISGLLSEVAAAEPVSSSAGDGDLDLDDLSSFFEKTTSGLVQNALAGFTEADQVPSQTQSETQSQSQSEPQSQSQSLIPTVEDVDATTQALAPASTTAPAGTVAPPENATSATTTETKPAQAHVKIDFITDYKELEALVAESTSNYVKTTLHGLSAVPYQPTVPTSTTESMAAQSAYLSHLQQHPTHHSYYTYTQPSIQEQQTPPPPGSTENLPPNQTFPSAVLYDKARQAALSKSSAHTRREGLHSTRRPWTQEEEKALMAGLDMVKGPHWSQILTLFGQNGTISDILKDRTQVQLKDKARNLKLFFLKTNSEMPYYLQAVTGELKTRAPTQAARKEAEERARLNSEEESAKLQGIMALAGGLPQQQPSQQQVRSAASSAVVAPGVVTPAQAAAHQVASAQHASHIQAAATAHHSPSTLPVSRGMVMPTPHIKVEMPSTTTAIAQQASQPVSQALSRPQAQTQHQPQQPQPQQQQQQQSQIQGHPPPQRQGQQQTSQQPQHDAQASRQIPLAQNGSQVSTPQQNAQNLSSLPPPASSSAPTQPQQTPQAHRPSQSSGPSQPSTSTTHSQQQSSPPGPAHAETHRASTVPEAPMSQAAAQDDDAATEALLLEGLQVAVAQALAS